MLVIFDGDGTLWSGDVLAGYLTTPLRCIDDDTVEDHQGKRVQLKEHVRDVLDVLQNKDIYVALASENRKLPVVALLQRLKLGQYFNFLEVSWTEKDEMVLKILKIFQEKDKETGKVYFIDDFEYNIEIVQENPQLQHVICINASELQSLKDVLEIIVTQTE
ncbi:MAG: magnesium-dependent phosphatase-1 [Theionarchaea archaeon]|nr:magnesium-dependent phosphatase-1 [Theionarchaea archaeon]